MSFERLVILHEAELRRFVFLRAPDPACAEEVVQATLVAFYQGLDRVPADTPVIAWIKGIARNQLRAEWRRLQRLAGHRNEILAHASADDDAVASFEREAEEDLLGRLRRCVDRLPERSRQMVEAFYAHGHSHNELARRFHRKQNAIAKGLSRIRAGLRLCIEREAV